MGSQQPLQTLRNRAMLKLERSLSKIFYELFKAVEHLSRLEDS
jgi:hypothetical protein